MAGDLKSLLAAAMNNNRKSFIHRVRTAKYMVFRDIFKGLKGEIEKRARPQEEQRREEARPEEGAAQSRYFRLAAWVKTRYGNRFRDGLRNVEVETQLENIFRELETKGAFKKHPKIANGFRAYISERKYGDLVKVSE